MKPSNATKGRSQFARQMLDDRRLAASIGAKHTDHQTSRPKNAAGKPPHLIDAAVKPFYHGFLRRTSRDERPHPIAFFGKPPDVTISNGVPAASASFLGKKRSSTAMHPSWSSPSS